MKLCKLYIMLFILFVGCASTQDIAREHLAGYENAEFIERRELDCEGCAGYLFKVTNEKGGTMSVEVQMQKNELTDIIMLPGSDTDVHGCKGSAGYVWCEEKQKCLKPWEEECVLVGLTAGSPTKDTAIEYTKNTKFYKENKGRSIVVGALKELECNGCYLVGVKYDYDYIKNEKTLLDRVMLKLTIEDETVVKEEMQRGTVVTPKQCEDRGGRVVNTLEDSCTKSETEIAEVDETLSNHICCKRLS